MMDSNSLTLNGGFNFIPEFGVAHSDLSPNLSEITLDGGHSLDYLSNAIPPNDGPQELMNLELSKSTSDMYNYITKELGGFSLEIPGEANTPVNTPVNLEHPFALIPSQVEPSPIFFPPASIETVQPVQQLLQPPLIHRQLHPLPEQLRIPLSSNVVRGHVRSKSLSTLADMQLENSTIFVNRLKKNNVISPPPPPTNNKNIIFAQQSPQPSSIPNPLPHDAVSPVNIVRTQSWSSPMPNLAAVSEEVSSVEKTSGGPLRVVIRKDKSPNTPISASIPSASPRHKENGVLLLPLPPLNVKRKESLSGAELVAKLDVELEKLDFNDVTVTELKDLLRQRGLPSTGKKVLLVERLQKELEQARIRKAARNQTQSSTPVILDSDLLSPSNSSGTESKANFPSRSLSSKTRGVMKHTHSRNKSFSDTRMLARTMRSEENPRMFRKLSSSSPSPLSTSFVTSADYSPQLNFINKPPTIASVMPFEPAQNCMQLDSG
ncbi:hypothetical protein HK098_004617 [Nowakowskiella sp. JEL0407]|nr:hypothetical protein HK098_004617 [Nowakowskiella sp. JEL0407]